jgi:hypothetical protein
MRNVQLMKIYKQSTIFAFHITLNIFHFQTIKQTMDQAQGIR